MQHFKLCVQGSFNDPFVVPLSCLFLVSEARERRHLKGGGGGRRLLFADTMCAAASAFVKVSWEKGSDEPTIQPQQGVGRMGGGPEGSHNVLKSTSKRNHSVGALTRAPLNPIHHLGSD